MKKSLLLLILAISIQGYSQTGTIDSLIVRYNDYYKMAPETVFVQLNKSQFFNGENLWFKAYVYDTKTQLPYVKTTNLYATVFDSKGHLMEQKLYHVEDGMTNGDFEIKTNYPPDTYIIKFSTNWMKNFNEDLSVKLSFTVLGESNQNFAMSEQTPMTEIQFFPEGGHFVSDLINTVGFKMNDNIGNGIKINSGKIIDSKGNVVSTFSSNDMGMGKLNINAESNENYRVEAILEDGTKIEQEFLKVEPKGIAVTINNLEPKQLFIGVKTNQLTLPSLLGKDFYILIHRDGSVKKVDFKFQSDVYDYTIPVSREMLFSGVNIITMFNDQNQPIFERITYNKTDGLIENLQLTSTLKIGDSTSVTFKTNDRSKNNLSISVLPSQNVTYDKSTSILSSFLLKPYVRGTIQNANYYFSNDDRKTTYDLDILLLTQGWSRLNWNDIFYKPQLPLNNFETGFQIVGKLNSNKKEDINKIVLFSDKDALMESTEVDKDGYFKFEDLHLSDSTQVSLSAKDAKGNLVKPKLYYNIFPKSYKDSLTTEDANDFMKSEKVQLKLASDNSDFDSFIVDNMVTLDTISLKTKKEKPRQKILNGSDGRRIDLEGSFNKFSRVIDVIEYNGFSVSESLSDISIHSNRNLGLTTFAQPTVYINNVESHNLNDLRYLTLRDVSDLYISTTPSLTGSGDSLGGSINIFLNHNLYANNTTETKFNSTQINLGFDKAKKYYTPNYDITRRDEFSKFGVITWIPNVSSNNQGEFIIKIPNNYPGDVTLYINGMSEKGSLISKTETIDLNTVEK